MVVYSFYLFDRSGSCLLYREWHRKLKSCEASDDQKNMFGMLFALRNLTAKLSPQQQQSTLPKYFITDVYALHYFETPTGLRFVLTTSPDFGNVDISHFLSNVYENAFVHFVLHNPLYVRGAPADMPKFLNKLDQYVRQLPCFF